MIGFRIPIKSFCFHAFPLLILSLIFLVTFSIDFLDGLTRSLPLYFLKFHPRKSKPVSIWVIKVFSSDSSRPLYSKKSFINSLTSSAISSVFAVTIKSSAYLQKLTLCFAAWWLFILPLLLLWYLSASSFSILSKVIFAKIGEISPPCGVPASVWNRWRSNT